VPLPRFQFLPLVRRPEPFSHPDWLFEIKYDGFRWKPAGKQVALAGTQETPPTTVVLNWQTELQ